MDRIAIAGLSLHDVELDGLERAKRRVVGDELGAARKLADALGASDVVLVSTCNRLEIAYAREEGHRPSRADVAQVAEVLDLGEDADGLVARLHHAQGRAAARHLFRVAASLDSLVVGEDQILSQVRDAFARAESARLCGPLLGALFRAAVQLGKEVRTNTELAHHPVSVVSIAVQRLVARAGDASPRVAVVGAGSMGELVARNLKAAGITPAAFANRTPARARALAERFGGAAIAIGELSGGPAVDAVISATSSPNFVLSAGELSAMAARAPLGTGLLAIDLAVPRDLEPSEDPAVELVDIERLRTLAEDNRARRARAAFEAEKLVERKLDVLDRRFTNHDVSEALAEIQRESADIVERELADLFGHRLNELGPEERRAIERWARSAFGRLTHVPLAAFKRFAAAQSPRDGGPEGEMERAR